MSYWIAGEEMRLDKLRKETDEAIKNFKNAINREDLPYDAMGSYPPVESKVEGSRFKVGPCRTVGGVDTATIFEISDKIYGKYKGNSFEWDLSGKADHDLQYASMDLRSNAAPMRMEFELGPQSITKVVGVGCMRTDYLTPFFGKRVRVTVEELP